MLIKRKIKENPYFSIRDNNKIVVKMPDNSEVSLPGIEPLVDETGTFTNIIGVYSKNGWLNKDTNKFIKRYRNSFKYIYMSSSGPYFKKKYKKLYKKYDAVTSLDCSLPWIHKQKNNLELSYSMLARCGALDNGFFWEPMQERTKDFSILTWYGDREAKGYDDAKKITKQLCEMGYTGIIVTQRGTKEDILKDKELCRCYEKGLLEVHSAEYDEENFHKVIAKAYISIFPNQLDAFPKHIIESLLANKGIVISDKLLFGKETLRNLGEEIVCVLDFDDGTASLRIKQFLEDYKKSNICPREEWLKRYDFERLSRIWAMEINRLFHTQYKQVYLMRHIGRYAK